MWAVLKRVIGGSLQQQQRRSEPSGSSRPLGTDADSNVNVNYAIRQV